MPIIIKHRGSFRKSLRYLTRIRKTESLVKGILDKYGQRGVAALSSATPTDTGLTASSWGYEVYTTSTSFVIAWTNSNVNTGVPIALILQYGHGTGTGGYVEGRDYINPAIRPIIDAIANEAWGEVSRVT